MEIVEREMAETNSVPRQRREWTRREFSIGALSLAALLLLAVYAGHWWTVGRFIQSTDDAYVGGEVTVIAPKVAG